MQYSRPGLVRALAPLALGASIASAGCGQSHSAEVCGEGGDYYEDGLGRYCAYVVIRSGFQCPPALRTRFDFAGGAVCSDLPVGADAGELPPQVCRYFGTAECGDPSTNPDAGFPGGPTTGSDAGAQFACVSSLDCAPGFACVDSTCLPLVLDAGRPSSDGGFGFDAGARSDSGVDGAVPESPVIPLECDDVIPDWTEPAEEWVRTVSHVNTPDEIIIDGDFLWVYATPPTDRWDLTPAGAPVVPLSVSEVTPGIDTCYRVESSVRYGDGRVVETGPFQTLGGSRFPYYLVGLDRGQSRGSSDDSTANPNRRWRVSSVGAHCERLLKF